MKSELPPAISLKRVSHWYGNRQVLDDLTFDVEPGKVTTLIGNNGVGKSTVIRLIMGLLDPTRGSCKTLGQLANEMTPETLQRIGFAVEGHSIPKNFSVAQTEKFCSFNRPKWDHDRFRQILSHFGISYTQRNGHLSRGQRAGVSLACVLSGSPELLILDDPALGLDPVNRRALNETILDFVASPLDESSQRTVLLTSHQLDDVERISDNIAIIAQGKLCVNTSLDIFQSRIAAYSIPLTNRKKQTELAKLIRSEIPGLLEIRLLSNQLIATLVTPESQLQHLTELQSRIGTELEPCNLSLEDMVIPYLNTNRLSHSVFFGSVDGEPKL